MTAPGSARRVTALAGLTVGTFAWVTVETMPIGLLAPMARELHVSESAIGLLVTLYALVVVLASIPLTQATRRVSRRTLLVTLAAGYVVTTVATALAQTWSLMLAVRVVAAIGQALFWSLVVPVAGGLFAAEVRGRVVAVVLSGSPLAAIAGVPLGVWLGQLVGWRWVFVALGVIGVVMLAATLALPAPTVDAGTSTGTAPDRRRFCALVVVTALATTGAFSFFTYVSPFLTTAAGISTGALSAVLLARGMAGFGGVAAAGALTDRHPRLAVAYPIAVQFTALAILFATPHVTPLVIVAVTATGFTFAAFTAPMATRAMTLAPGRTDLAASTISTAVNVGITVGALAGSGALALFGARSTALVAAGFTAAALIATRWDRSAPHRPDSHADRDTPPVDVRTPARVHAAITGEWSNPL